MTPTARTGAIAGFGLAVLAGVAGLLLSRRTPPPPPPSAAAKPGARFVSIEGDVRVRRWGELEWLPANAALVLHENDQLRTSAKSQAQLRLIDGTVVTVRPYTLARLEESTLNPSSRQPGAALSIPAGGASFETPAHPTHNRTTLSTPTVSASLESDTAGSLEVADGGATGLRVFRGAGEAQTRKGQKVRLGANEGLEVDAGGTAGPKVALPPAPRLSAPSDLAEIAYPDLEGGVTPLLWSAVPGASRYRLMVDYSPSFTRPIHDRKDHRSTQWELRALEAGPYCWRVAALAADGAEGSFSETWCFTLSKAPARAASAPALEIETLELKGNVLHVRGHTERGATLLLNGEPIKVLPDGSFNEFVIVAPGADAKVWLRATSATGGVAELLRRAGR